MFRNYLNKITVLIFTVLFLLSGCTPKKKQAASELTLVMAEVNAEDSICGQMDHAFKQKVEELSKNKIIINIKYNGILGDEKHVLQSLMTADSYIHLARVGANLSAYGAKKSALLSIPYTFENNEHFWKFTQSQAAQEILNEAYEKNTGIKGLFFAEEGFRHFISSRPVYSVKSIRGKKMRVSGTILTGIANSLEAEPVYMNFNRLARAFASGEIQLADQPLSNYYADNFYICAPYVILDAHMIGAVQTVISASCWDSLSEEQQKIFIQAGQYAQDFCRQIEKDSEAENIRILTEKGVSVTRVSDKTPWKNACSDFIQKSSEEYPELYKQILESVN